VVLFYVYYQKRNYVPDEPEDLRLELDPNRQVQILTNLTKEIQIPYSQLTFGDTLGKGSQGEVFRGTYARSDVAIKRINSQNVEEAIIQEFCMEADINMRLRHPNLTLFRGVSLEHPHLCIITEVVERGSLFDILRDENSGITWKRSLRIARDVAKAMIYLHEHHPPVLHRDLKSLNILVSKDWVGKVADLGMTRFAVAGEQDMTQCGSPLWMSPEMVCNHPYTEKADVYSFAICLWEMYTKRIPYSDLGLSPKRLVVEVVKAHLRPSIPDTCPRRYANMLQRAWSWLPDDRPTFQWLADELEEMLDDPEIFNHVPNSTRQKHRKRRGTKTKQKELERDSKSEEGWKITQPSVDIKVDKALPFRDVDATCLSPPERYLATFKSHQVELVKIPFDHEYYDTDPANLLLFTKNTMKRLYKLRHPHICLLYGAYIVTDHLGVLIENLSRPVDGMADDETPMDWNTLLDTDSDG
jgi:serine/threonine protein kinase